MVNFQEYVDISTFTTFRVGGKARYFVVVRSEEELFEVIVKSNADHLSLFILGGGSNVLFSDEGWNGIVAKIEYDFITEGNDGVLHVGAGASLCSIIQYTCDRGLVGIERLAGIPGTIGGAIRGNSGAFGAEIGSVIRTVRTLNTVSLSMSEFSKTDCQFAYHSSFFKRHPEIVILSATLVFQSGGDSHTLNTIVWDTLAIRESKHPQKLSCAGSFFMNPTVIDQDLRREFERETGVVVKDDKLAAGWIIDYVGLRGKAIGDAKVSDLHANYILNTGKATAEDILILASLIKQRVRTQLNIRLQEEVQMVGF